MPDFMDAPAIDFDETAEITDVYVIDGPPETQDSDPGDTAPDAVMVDMLFGDASAPVSRESLDLGQADAFVFAVFQNAGYDGAAAPDTGTPAPEPEEEEPQPGTLEFERKHLGGARHTAMGAMLQSFLIYG